MTKMSRKKKNQKWAASWQNQQNDCVPSKDSDQPGWMPRLIWVFPGRKVCAKQRLRSAWADAQADLSHPWAQSHFVGFVTRRLKSQPWVWGDIQTCANHKALPQSRDQVVKKLERTAKHSYKITWISSIFIQCHIFQTHTGRSGPIYHEVPWDFERNSVRFFRGIFCRITFTAKKNPPEKSPWLAFKISWNLIKCECANCPYFNMLFLRFMFST